MQSQNRHLKYRRNIYRKRRIKIILLSCLSAIAFIAVLFILIGNALGNRVADNITKRSSKESNVEQAEHTIVPSVRSYPIPLFEETSKLSTRLTRAYENGYTEVCFEFNSKASGDLLYSSPIAKSLGKQTDSTSLWSVEEIVQLCDKNNLYATGIIYLNEFYVDNDLARSAALGYYSAQISEILRGGIDDVLICVDQLPLEQYDELIELANEIHRLCPDGRIGISLPPEIFANQDTSNVVDKIWGAFDYLAVDISVIPEGINSTDHIQQKLGGMLYYLLRLNVRVLVPYSNDPAVLTALSDAVTSNGSQNIQFMP